VPARRDFQTDMILPCRIHQPRNRVDLLSLALLFAACLLASVTEAMGQYAAGVPFEITAGVDFGYDDNATLTPSGESSLFAGENVVLYYERPGKATQFYMLGIGRFAQYFDVSRNDVNGNVTMSLTHNFSTRLSFYASVFAAYQTEPNFRSNVGPENVV
jgi:hypothetical protein